MPKPTQKVELKSLSKGIITEAGPLAFPADATLDEQNFDLTRSNIRSRRNGMDFEPNHAARTFDPDNQFTTVAIWTSVNGDPETEFVVVQSGGKLYFYDKSVEDISRSGYLGTISLTAFDGELSQNYSKFTYASLEGVLLVAGGANEIAVVSYDAGVFTATYEYLQTRDVWGVEVV